MPVYRYGPEGIRAIQAQTRRQVLIFHGLLLLCGFGFLVFKGGDGFRFDLVTLLPFLFLAAVLAYSAYRSYAKVGEMLGATRIAFDGETLSGESKGIKQTIVHSQIRQLREIPDGLEVHGASMTDRIVIRKELEGYSELRRQVEEWAGPGIPKIESKQSLAGKHLAISIGMVVLCFGAFTIETPWIGIPLCLAVAAVLIFSGFSIWKSQAMSPKSRRIVFVLALPLFGVLARAWAIANQ